MFKNVAACCTLAWLIWNCSAVADDALLFATKSNTLIQVTGTDAVQLSNGLGDIYVGRTNQDLDNPPTISIRRGLIQFNPAAAIPQGALVTSATLTLDNVNGLVGNESVTLSPMYRDWGQGTSNFNGGGGTLATNGDVTWFYTFYHATDPPASPTWNAPGGLAGVDYSATPNAGTLITASGDANQSFTWSSSGMVNDIQGWLDNTAKDFGWILIGNESTGITAKRFGGQNAASPENPPQLAVQFVAPCAWSGSASSVWSQSNNWTNGSGVPGSSACILMGDANAASGTVDLLSTTASIARLTFAASRSMTITSTTGHGRLTVDNGGNPAAIVVSGSGHSIDGKATIALNSELLVTVNGSGDALDIAANINNGSAANGLVKNGLGALVLSGTNAYTGGTTVEAGTLIIASRSAITNGTSLTVGAGAMPIVDKLPIALSSQFGPDASTASAVVVPEPGAIKLFFGSALTVGLAIAFYRRNNLK